MRTHKLFHGAWIAIMTIGMAGCEPEELAVAVPVVKTPADLPSAPATPPPTGTPGSTPTSEIPRTSVPGRLSMIKWAPLDYKSFEYNAEGRLVTYTTQYNSVQGTDIVTKDVYTYHYNSQGQVTSVVTREGFKTEYSYAGEVWKEALSFDKLNRPLKKYLFTFNSQKQLTRYKSFRIDLQGKESPESIVDLTYENGNLTRWNESYYNAETGNFVLSTQLALSNFDNKKHAHNANSFGYILQPLTFWKNNPGKKEFIGNASPIESYSYVYDADGYPVKKRTTYTYDKPLPAMECEFVY
ncbi:MAG TPA: hypothetical protein VGD90_07395 [Sphingobacteriaceae bacterium]